MGDFDVAQRLQNAASCFSYVRQFDSPCLFDTRPHLIILALEMNNKGTNDTHATTRPHEMMTIQISASGRHLGHEFPYFAPPNSNSFCHHVYFFLWRMSILYLVPLRAGPGEEDVGERMFLVSRRHTHTHTYALEGHEIERRTKRVDFFYCD